jgi:hypothetical protein
MKNIPKVNFNNLSKDVNILITHDPIDYSEEFIKFRKELKELKVHCWGHVQ